MSESVKIGGIGKNPAIDKINILNAVEVKDYAVNHMETMILSSTPIEYENHMEVPIGVREELWEGKKNGTRID